MPHIHLTLGGSAANLGRQPIYLEDSPLSILGAKLKLWFDAGQGVTQAGGAVTAWEDRIGGVVVTNAGFSPCIYNAAGFAGYPTVRGDGVGAALGAAQPASLPSGTNEGWIWVVGCGYDVDNPGGLTRTIVAYGNTGTTTRRALRRNGSDRPNTYAGVNASADAQRVFGPHYGGANFYDAGAHVSGEWDGAAMTAVASAYNTTSNRLRLFCSVDNVPTNTFADYEMSQVLVTTALTQDERAALRPWLAWRAGF